MKFEIEGTVAQSVRLTFGESETAWASKGSMIAYSAGIRWDMKVPGGVAGALKRSLSGEGMTLTFLESAAAGETATLGANAPGHIEVWDLAGSGPVITTRGAFLAAWGDRTDISVSIARRAGAALFGGAGLVLQRIGGTGTCLVHGKGDFDMVKLGRGEPLRVSTGNLAAFSDSIDYAVETVGSLRKTLFSREGLFMTRLTGPGTVLIQTLKSRQRGGAAPGGA